MNLNNIHARGSGITDIKNWLSKSIKNGKIIDSAIAVSFMLLSGWLIYCLVKPFWNYQITS